MPMEGNIQNDRPGFIADENVGKLARLLRLLGFDTLLFEGGDDSVIVDIALAENRIVLTRDTRIPERRPIAGGRVKAILLHDDRPEAQIRQVIDELDLKNRERPFTICLECNRPLEKRTPRDVADRVPPYVMKTQNEYVECPGCRRIYWKGTHWTAMTEKLNNLYLK